MDYTQQRRRHTSPPKRRAPLEVSEQIAIAHDLDGARVDGKPVDWCHVPNEGSKSQTTAAILQKSGVKSGIPDVLIFTPPPAFPDHHGAAIEIKRADGKDSDVSTDQSRWLSRLSAHGWLTGVAFGAAQAREFLRVAGYIA